MECGFTFGCENKYSRANAFSEEEAKFARAAKIIMIRVRVEPRK